MTRRHMITADESRDLTRAAEILSELTFVAYDAKDFDAVEELRTLTITICELVQLAYKRDLVGPETGR